VRLGLDLPGWFTSALPADIYDGSNNVAIARGSIIEHAKGGSAADIIFGNTVRNSLTGGAGDDTILGYAGNDTLDGGSGNDSMTGGEGNDLYYVRDSNDVVTEAASEGTDTVYSYLSSYTLGSNVENGRVMSNGTASLTGNGHNNFIYTGKGNNVINGGSGTDSVSYYNGNNGTGVTVSLVSTAAQTTGGSGSDTLSSIENLYGTNYADKFTGNTGANYLRGYSGNDTLDGGTGYDTMVGNAGNDYYYVRDRGDMVTEAVSEGTDAVYSYLSSYTLGANVENGRIMSTSAANLTGNTLNNVIYAGAGDNVIKGEGGADTLSYANGLTSTATVGVTVSLASAFAQVTGGSGKDTLSGFENLTGSSKNDKLTGSTGNNILTGGSGNDSLSGGDGNDTLVGGAGQDMLSGGVGNDVFDFNALTEMGITSSTWDIITDFSNGDRIDLSTLDANTATTVNDAFNGALIGTNVAFTAAGQLKLISGVLYGNVDADSGAEFAIALTGVTTLSAAEFIL
jgi:Ca2+-binding RTX toxin-like protein